MTTFRRYASRRPAHLVLAFVAAIILVAGRGSGHLGLLQAQVNPIPAENLRPASVYQKEIDNTTGKDDMVLDYRLPIHGDQIPLIYLKYRPFATRFANQNSFAELGETGKFFSTTELQNILQMARKMGVDYGALDVLRDKDGRIYVVDVNNTPNGPPNGLPLPESKIGMERMTGSFFALLEQWKI